jgi:hypothetical protein
MGKSRKQLHEVLDNPVGRQLLEALFRISASEMINLDWSEFQLATGRLNDNFHIRIELCNSIVTVCLSFFVSTDFRSVYIWSSREICYVKNAIEAIWEFCNGYMEIPYVLEIPKFREYLLTSGIFTNENIILRSNRQYDTFKELVIKCNPPRHSMCDGEYPVETELVFMMFTKIYDVREIAKTMPNMKYLYIDYKSKIINPIDTVHILRYESNDGLPILMSRDTQRNVKSANK